MGCSSGSAQEKGKTGWNSVITKKIDGFEQGWRVIIVVVHMSCSSGSAQEKKERQDETQLSQKKMMVLNKVGE